MPRALPLPPLFCRCSSWENHCIPYLAPGLFNGDKGPATVAAHALHHWALRHMGEPPVVGLGGVCVWGGGGGGGGGGGVQLCFSFV